MANSSETKVPVWQQIADRIIADLEKGNLSWRKPWVGGASTHRPLRSTGVPYSGINILILWAIAAEKGFKSPYWMTFNQAKEFGATVKKGEKAATVVYASKFTVEEESKKNENETIEKSIFYMKAYYVFNADQIEGLPEKFYPQNKITIVNKDERNNEIDTFFENTGAVIEYGNYNACYIPSLDVIRMPEFLMFRDSPAFYATQAHELIHWTMHGTRLNRKFLDEKETSKESYAKEELVAEIGSCFLASELGFEPEWREDHSAYIGSWLKALKNDKRLIFKAASHAQKAIDFLMKLQPNYSQVPDYEAVE